MPCLWVLIPRTVEFGADGLPDVVALNIAGFPGSKPLGQMWFDYCTDVELPFGSDKPEFVFHNCTTTNGNSGSPMWTYTPADGSRRIAAVHTSQTIQVIREDPLTFDVLASATFLTGDLLEELQNAIDEMECSTP